MRCDRERVLDAERGLDLCAATFAGVRLPLPAGTGASGSVILGIRPQDIAVATDASVPSIEVEPAVVEELGSSTQAIFHIDAPPLDTEAVRAATAEGDSTVLLHTERRALFTAALEEGTPVVVGEPLHLAFDPTRFHFFVPETGARID